MQCYKDTKLQDYRVPERFRNTQIEGKIVSFFYAGGGGNTLLRPPALFTLFHSFRPHIQKHPVKGSANKSCVYKCDLTNKVLLLIINFIYL